MEWSKNTEAISHPSTKYHFMSNVAGPNRGSSVKQLLRTNCRNYREKQEDGFHGKLIKYSCVIQNKSFNNCDRIVERPKSTVKRIETFKPYMLRWVLHK
jgi:hypothetical protein